MAFSTISWLLALMVKESFMVIDGQTVLGKQEKGDQ